MTAKKQPEALQMLMDDHKEVKSLFARFEKLGDGDSDKKPEIIEQVCQMLTAHAQLEEELFYPAVKEKIEEPSLIEEATVEHQVAKDLIAQLQGGIKDEEQRDATFVVLCEYVDHHVQEEEKELFPQIRKTDLDLEALGEEMAERKAELADELTSGDEAKGGKTAKTRAAPRSSPSKTSQTKKSEGTSPTRQAK